MHPQIANLLEAHGPSPYARSITLQMKSQFRRSGVRELNEKIEAIKLLVASVDDNREIPRILFREYNHLTGIEERLLILLGVDGHISFARFMHEDPEFSAIIDLTS